MTNHFWFNALPETEAAQQLMACCTSPAWAASVVAARPYASEAHLVDTAARLAAQLDWAEVSYALAAHPRIGERPTGTDRESSWSRQEQSAASADADAFVAANRRYEARFGHIYLVCATGRTAPDLLADLNSRLANDPATEREVVTRELSKIVRLRVEKMVTS